MNIKTTLVLLVLLILVAIGFYAVTNRPAGPVATGPSPVAAGARVLPGLDAEAVDRVTIQRGDQTVVLARDADGWMQVEPVRFPLDGGAVDRLVRAAAGLEPAATFTPGAGDMPTLEDVGLAPPRATVQLGADSPTLLLGRTAIGGQAYVKLADAEEVVVTGGSLQEQIVAGSLLDFRQKTLSTGPLPSVTGLALRPASGEAVQLQRVDGAWRLGDGAGQRADGDAVRQLIGSVGRVRAQAFVADAPESLGPYGLGDPSLVVSVMAERPDGEAREQTLKIGAPADMEGQTLYAMWTTPRLDLPVVFTISKADADRLRKTADDLRDPRLFTATPAEAQRITIDRAGDAPIVLMKTDGGTGTWGFGEDVASFAADADQTAALVRSVLGAEAERYTADLPTGEPVATVSVAAPTRAEPETAAVFAPSAAGEPYLAVPAGADVAYVVPPADLAGVTQPLRALRDRTVLSIDADALTTVELHQPDGRMYTFTRDDDDGWTLDRDTAFERQSLRDLLNRLAPLRATGWTDDDALPAGGTVTLTLAGNDTRTLTVAPEANVATVDGVAGVFSVAPQLVDLLTAEYRERAVLPVSAEQVRTITITRDGRSATIRRAADGTYTTEPAMSDEQAAAVATAVAGLRVERWAEADADAVADGPGVQVELTADDGRTWRLTLRPADVVLPSIVRGEGEAKTFVAPQSAYDTVAGLLSE